VTSNPHRNSAPAMPKPVDPSPMTHIFSGCPSVMLAPVSGFGLCCRMPNDSVVIASVRPIAQGNARAYFSSEFRRIGPCSRPLVARQRGLPVLIGSVADDITGATDLCLMPSRAGLHTVQVIGVPQAGQALPQADAVVIALKSRTVPAAQAVSMSLASGQALLGTGAATSRSRQARRWRTRNMRPRSWKKPRGFSFCCSPRQSER
jgi:Sugar-binding N-terminal domain